MVDTIATGILIVFGLFLAVVVAIQMDDIDVIVTITDPAQLDRFDPERG